MFQFSGIIRVKRDSKAATTVIRTVLPMPAATLEVPRVCSLRDSTWQPPHPEALHNLSRLSAPTLTQTADNKGRGSNFLPFNPDPGCQGQCTGGLQGGYRGAYKLQVKVRAFLSSRYRSTATHGGFRCFGKKVKRSTIFGLLEALVSVNGMLKLCS